jgi:hypothetical protein
VQSAVAEQPVELLTATPAPGKNPAAMSAQWTAGATTQPRSKPNMSLFAVVGAALTVGVLIFIAVKMLVLDAPK